MVRFTEKIRNFSSLSAMLKVLGDGKFLTDFREKTDNEFLLMKMQML
jgi:hypothetical protein